MDDCTLFSDSAWNFQYLSRRNINVREPAAAIGQWLWRRASAEMEFTQRDSISAIWSAESVVLWAQTLSLIRGVTLTTRLAFEPSGA